MNVLGIIGPSGCGKSVIVKQLSRKEIIALTPTITERPVRYGEKELEHRFVTAQEFDLLEKEGGFLEVVHPFGLPYRYGLPKIRRVEGKVSVVVLRAMFLPLFYKHYPKSLIYQIEAPLNEVKPRLEKRGSANLGTRLSDFGKETILGRKSANRIFLNSKKLEQLVNEIELAIRQDFSSILSQKDYKRADLTDR